MTVPKPQREQSPLAQRGRACYLTPCPRCDGAGLHKAACLEYQSRLLLQAKNNQSPKQNSHIGGLLGGMARRAKAAQWVAT